MVVSAHGEAKVRDWVGNLHGGGPTSLWCWAAWEAIIGFACCFGGCGQHLLSSASKIPSIYITSYHSHTLACAGFLGCRDLCSFDWASLISNTIPRYSYLVKLHYSIYIYICMYVSKFPSFLFTYYYYYSSYQCPYHINHQPRKKVLSFSFFKAWVNDKNLGYRSI